MADAGARAAPTGSARVIGFDERLAHLIEGGADMFLMPSRYEPCGLNQMYSLRYGTVPVVRATGGLVDSVAAVGPGDQARHRLPLRRLQRRRHAGGAQRGRCAPSATRPQWKRLQQNGMKADFSWDRSAREYVKVYKRVIAATRGRRPRDCRPRLEPRAA